MSADTLIPVRLLLGPRGARAMSGADDSAEAENPIAVDAAEDIRNPLDGLVEREAQAFQSPHSVDRPETLAPDLTNVEPLIDHLPRVAPACDAANGPDPDSKRTAGPADGPDAADEPVRSADLDAAVASVGPDDRGCLPAASGSWLSHGRFEMSEAGLFETVNRKQVPTSEFISSPFWIDGSARDASGNGWCHVLRWIDPDGREHEQELVPDSALSGDARRVAAGLADKGLVIRCGKAKSFAEYLQGCSVARRLRIVDRAGWHEIDGRLDFVLPHCPMRGSDRDDFILKHSEDWPNYQIRGTLEEWQEGVGSLTMGQLVPIFAVSTAFAGPVLHLLGQEGGGIHLYGPSSSGKTTALRAAASVWGSGATPGYMHSWNTTDNGLEAKAAGACDTVLILDELGQIESSAAHQAAYMLANGSGKARAKHDGSGRPVKEWRVLFLSSGEMPSERKLAEGRRKRAQAGQLVRMLDVPSDRGLGFGVFDPPGPFHDAATLSKALKAAASSAYGSAGPEFVRRILERGADKIAANGKLAIESFCSKVVPPGVDAQVERAAERFAVVGFAGELARELGVVAWEQGHAYYAAAQAFAQWLDARGGGESMEEKRAIEQVRGIIEAYGESRFDELEDGHVAAWKKRPVANRLGWREGAGPKRFWYIPPETWKDIFCNGLDPSFVARVLASRRMLRPGKDGPSNHKRINGRTSRVYLLTPEILDGEPEFQTIDEEYYAPPEGWAEGMERIARLEAKGKVTRSIGEAGQRIFRWSRA
jgi:putative DNA primase/helicase